MNSHRPEPIRHPHSPPPVKRIITFVLSIVLLVLLSILAWRLWQLAHPRLPTVPPPPVDSPETDFEHHWNKPDFGQMLTDPRKVGSALPNGATPLDNEPAGLPVPPNSELLLRYQTAESVAADRAVVQQICVRTLPDTTLESAASFYRQSLQSAGEPFTEQIPAPMVLRLTAPAPGTGTETDGRSLLIRLRQADSEVRVVIQLRYTKHTDS